jgi:RNA polymerase sigma-70 factor (ECF subfamily)
MEQLAHTEPAGDETMATQLLGSDGTDGTGDPRAASDDALLAIVGRCGTDDPDRGRACEVLHDRAGDWLRRVFRVVGGACGEEADDLVQETFCRLLGRGCAFDPARGSARGYLFAVARNVARDHARASAARARHQRLVGGRAELERLADPPRPDRDFADIPYALIENPDARRVIALAAQGYRLAQIAAELNVTYWAAAQLKHRAIVSLRVCLSGR